MQYLFFAPSGCLSANYVMAFRRVATEPRKSCLAFIWESRSKLEMLLRRLYVVLLLKRTVDKVFTVAGKCQQLFFSCDQIL